MKPSTLLVILVLAAAIIFAYQNEPLLRQTQEQTTVWCRTDS